MEDDFGYEGRRRRGRALVDWVRTFPLVATGVFTAALLLLIFTTVNTPMTWNEALPWDAEPSTAPAAAPINPDAPVPHTPAPQNPGVRASASATPARLGASAGPSTTAGAAASPSPSPAPPPAAPRTVRHEAESATGYKARAANDHRNFSGSGFMDYENTTGSYLQWSVPGAAGQAILRLRFANATTRGRPMEISVNGTTVLRDVRFDPTRDWDDWATVTVTVTLTGGNNTIRATATTGDGGPNVDYLELVQ